MIDPTLFGAFLVGSALRGNFFVRVNQRDQISNIPMTIRQTCFHCGCNFQRLVNPNEVVIHEVQRNSVGVVSTFFEKAFVRRVNRRMCIRMVRFCRSTCEVEIFI